MNHIKISGYLEKLYFSHTVLNRPRYEGILCVPRPSGACDHILIQMWETDLTVGNPYTVEGEIRTSRYRGEDPHHPHKITYVIAYSIAPCVPELIGQNEVEVSGTVVYKSNLRVTPITDRTVMGFQICTPSKHHQSYLNVVVWGRTAETLAEKMPMDVSPYIKGRLHSREYLKENSIYRIHEICATEVAYLGKDTKSNPSET